MRRIPVWKNGFQGLSLSASVIMITAISVLVASSAVVIVVDEEGIVEKAEDATHTYFHLETLPSHRNATLYEFVTYEVHLVPHIYLYAPCRLRVLDLYDGVISTIEPDVIYPGEFAVLNLSGSVEGSFFREIIGTFNGQKDAVKVTLKVEGSVEDADSGMFDLKAEPVERTTEVGSPVRYTIGLVPGEDHQGYVDLKVLDCFDGVISSIYPESICKDQTATLVLEPMIPGTFEREIVGFNEDHEACVKVELIVHGKRTY